MAFEAAPHSPWPRREARETAPGQTLFNCASEFYAWYGSWDLLPEQHADTFARLSELMQIAHVSLSGGRYLTEKEERRAVDSLMQLREDLYIGAVKQEEILKTLLAILQQLTESNPKAKLVSCATQLEYRLCIRPRKNDAPQSVERCRVTLEGIISQVRPDLLDINAYAAAQGLANLLAHIDAIEDACAALQEAIYRWI
jgi:hypothetical protein